MLTNVLDGNGVSQVVILAGQESIADRSGVIGATGVAQSLLSANSLRSGWIIQNRGVAPMYVNDLGVATAGAGSFVIPTGGTFPPANYPVTVNAISVLGTVNDPFTVREW